MGMKRLRPLFILIGILIGGLSLAGCSGSLPGNDPPVIDSLSVNSVNVSFDGGTIPLVKVPTTSTSVLLCTAHDPNRDPITFAWTGIATSATSQNNTSSVNFTPTTDGDTLVNCTVSDDRGGTTSRTVTLHAVTMKQPTVSLAAAAPTVAPLGTDVLTATATDPDSPVASYRFAVVAGTGTVAQDATDKTKATFTAPAAPETDTVLCYVTDNAGNANTALVTIPVK